MMGQRFHARDNSVLPQASSPFSMGPRNIPQKRAGMRLITISVASARQLWLASSVLLSFASRQLSLLSDQVI